MADLVLALPRDVEDELCELSSAIVQRTSTLGTLTVLMEGSWGHAGFATLATEWHHEEEGTCCVSVKVTDVKVYDTDAVHVSVSTVDGHTSEQCTVLIKKKKVIVQSTLAPDGSYPRILSVPFLIAVLRDLKAQIGFTFKQ